MAQLFFKYGAMNSGKTIEILKVAHNYEEQNKPVVLMTSGLDTREGVGMVSSRIGLKREATPIFPETNVYEIMEQMPVKPYCILVDESQFLLKKHVIEFARVVDELKIPVMAFGLKNDFRNELFEGSKYLLLYADKIEELKTICWFCHKKATMNLHYIDGKPVYEGDQVQIGGNEAYYPVCRHHYFHPEMNEEGEK
ncbi:thymidine kinase [Enterococcus sp. JM4C]|uniref:thymidine kinase n=1 Tax=Candidatus Enterococcus huntleyi TaxID=1857217 RepID=UPI0013798CB0|nr:thymidine kinase [Enterococcus sp. JM4C]KAF1299637.1 thymidine kinase [Enterococcus sp. JM4C]